MHRYFVIALRKASFMVNDHFMFMHIIDMLEIHTRNIPEQQNDLLAIIGIRFLADNIIVHL
jgi:hypothetical protein